MKRPNDGEATVPTRILLADDHPALRSGVKALIDDQPDLVVVAEVGDGTQVVKAVAIWQPDVLILDVEMPNFDAVATTKHLTTTYPDLQILIFTVHDDEEYVYGLLEAGAVGYVLKEETTTNLVHAIRSVARGKLWLSSPIAHQVAYRALGHGPPASEGPLAKLTPREREVLKLIGAGFANRQIARHLVIAEKTVETHISSLYKKLGLTNRQQAVRFAIRHRLVDP